MAKEIKNPIEVTLKFNKIGNNWTVESVTHYGVGLTEYPEFNSIIRKSLGVVLTPTQETTIKNFAATVIYPQILINEGA